MSRDVLTENTRILDIDNDTYYDILEYFSYGGFSIVYKARKKGSGANCLLKEIFPIRGCHRNNEKIIVSDDVDGTYDIVREMAEKENNIYNALRTDESGTRHTYFSEECRLFKGVPVGTKSTNMFNFYIELGYIGGKSLQQIISENGNLKLKDCCEYTECILNILSHCHNKGYLHLDIAPDNIYVYNTGTSEKRLTLIDFNNAQKLRTDGVGIEDIDSILGKKVPFSAPELVKACRSKTDKQSLAFSTDIFSVASMFYYMMSGKSERFDNTSVENNTLIQSIAYNSIKNFLIKGLNVNQENRFQTTNEMLEALGRIKDDCRNESIENFIFNINISAFERLEGLDENIAVWNFYPNDVASINKTRDLISTLYNIVTTQRIDISKSREGLEGLKNCALTLQTLIAVYNSIGGRIILHRGNFETLDFGMIVLKNDVLTSSELCNFNLFLKRYCTFESTSVCTSVKIKEDKLNIIETYVNAFSDNSNSISIYNDVLERLKNAYSVISKRYHNCSKKQEQTIEKKELNITISEYLNCICTCGSYLTEETNGTAAVELIEHLIDTHNHDTKYMNVILEKTNELFPRRGETEIVNEVRQLIYNIFKDVEQYDNCSLASFTVNACSWLKENKCFHTLREIIGNGCIDALVWSAYLIVNKTVNKNHVNSLKDVVSGIINSGNDSRKIKFNNEISRMDKNCIYAIYYSLIPAPLSHAENPFDGYLVWLKKNYSSKSGIVFPGFLGKLRGYESLSPNAKATIEAFFSNYSYNDNQSTACQNNTDDYKAILAKCLKTGINAFGTEDERHLYIGRINLLLDRSLNNNVIPIKDSLKLIALGDELSQYDDDTKSKFDLYANFAYEYLKNSRYFAFDRVNLDALLKLLKWCFCKEDASIWCICFLKDTNGVLQQGAKGYVFFSNFVHDVISHKMFFNTILENRQIQEMFVKQLLHARNVVKNNKKATSGINRTINYLLATEQFEQLPESLQITLFHYAKNVTDLTESIHSIVEFFKENEVFWNDHNGNLPLKAVLCTYYDSSVLEQKEYILNFVSDIIVPNLNDRDYITNTLKYIDEIDFGYHIVGLLSDYPEKTTRACVVIIDFAYITFVKTEMENVTSITKEFRRLKDRFCMLMSMLSHPMLLPYSHFTCKRICEILAQNREYRNRIQSDNRLRECLTIIRNISENHIFPDWYGKKYKIDEPSCDFSNCVKAVIFSEIEPPEGNVDRNSQSYIARKQDIETAFSNLMSRYETLKLSNYQLLLKEVAEEGVYKYQLVKGVALYAAFAELFSDWDYDKYRNTPIESFVFPNQYFEKPELETQDISLISSVESISEKNSVTDLQNSLISVRKTIIDKCNRFFGNEQLFWKLNQVGNFFNSGIGNNGRLQKIDDIIRNNRLNSSSIEELTSCNNICEKLNNWIEEYISQNNIQEYLYPDKEILATITEFPKNCRGQRMKANFIVTTDNGNTAKGSIHIRDITPRYRNIGIQDVLSINQLIKIKYIGVDNMGYIQWQFIGFVEAENS